MVNWDQWQTLLAVYRSGVYAKAAPLLQVNATTVGRRLKLLEQQLGYPLFFRQEGHLHPTYQCEALIAHLETASEILRAAEQDSTSAESGVLWRDVRMTAPPFLIRHRFAPAVFELTKAHRIRIELMGTGSHVSLSRREADIAVRIEDRPPPFKSLAGQVDARRIGSVAYKIYCRRDLNSERLPWAGLMEDYVRTTGSDAMARLAGNGGFQFRAYHFDVLAEIAATGAARTMLPCVAGDGDKRLKSVSDVMLEQPLWMLSHRQDRDVHHLKRIRLWIEEVIREQL
ncbi:MAG: LysR family transcriptional regulator [Geminicoccaceae bacterium]